MQTHRKPGYCRMGIAGWMAGFLLLTTSHISAAELPVVGSAYVYRLSNGYSRETRAQLRYEVTSVDTAGVTLQVTPDNPDGGTRRTEVVNQEGNFLRRVLDSHGARTAYEFATPYPAYVFPLDTGKSWSMRVHATVPGLAKMRSVRVDGRVLGRERIRVPAGEFDTVKIRRFVYPGDVGLGPEETRINELEWYAPALGRVVRIEKKSGWLDKNQCVEEYDCSFYGDWDVLELVEVSAGRRY